MMKKLLICMALAIMFTGIAYASDDASPIIRSTTKDHITAIPSDIILDTEEDMLAYDGAPTSYYPADSINGNGTRYAVRFTPAQACTLSYVQIVSYQAPGAALIHIMSDSAGIPGHDLRTPFSANLNGGLTYQQINVNPSLNIGPNQFHVVVEYTRNSPPFVTVDNLTGTGRSKIKRAADANYSTLNRNLNFRAFVRYYGSDMVPPVITHTWRSYGFTMEGNHPLNAIIADGSGIASATIHYSINGVDYNTAAMTNSTGNNWSGAIPNQPAGTIIRYYLTAIDNSPNSNQGILPAQGAGAPFIMTIVDGVELSYDDGTQDAWWIVDPTYDGNAFAIRMTPTFYPAKVIMARAYVSGESPFGLSINGVSAGAPGAELPGGEYAETAIDPTGWGVASWAPGPTITAGSFFLLFHWLEATPDDPAVGEDTSSGALRSSWFTNTAGWNAVTDGEWMMRTVVNTPTGIEEIGPDGAIPAKYEVLGNYPNPFNPTTEIKYLAPKTGAVKIDVYNVAGQLVKTVFNGTVEAGIQKITWDGKDANGSIAVSGVYFYKLSAGDQVSTGKMVLLK
jgi:hypothetical protein